jgi:hypothetical protein
MVKFTDTLSDNTGAMVARPVAEPADTSFAQGARALSGLGGALLAGQKQSQASADKQFQRQINEEVFNTIQGDINSFQQSIAEGVTGIGQGKGLSSLEVKSKLFQKQQELNARYGGAASPEIAKAFESTIGFNPIKELDTFSDTLVNKQIDQEFKLQNSLMEEGLKNNIPFRYDPSGALDFEAMKAESFKLNEILASTNVATKINETFSEGHKLKIQDYTGSLATSSMRIAQDVNAVEQLPAVDQRFYKIQNQLQSNQRISPDDESFYRQYVTNRSNQMRNAFVAGLNEPLNKENNQLLTESIEESYAKPLLSLADAGSVASGAGGDYQKLLNARNQATIAETQASIFQKVPEIVTAGAIKDTVGEQGLNQILSTGDTVENLRKSIKLYNENHSKLPQDLSSAELSTNADAALNYFENINQATYQFDTPQEAQGAGMSYYRLLQPITNSVEDINLVTTKFTTKNAAKNFAMWSDKVQDPDLRAAVGTEINNNLVSLRAYLNTVEVPDFIDVKQDKDTGVLFLQTKPIEGDLTPTTTRSSARFAAGTVTRGPLDVERGRLGDAILRNDLEKYTTALNSYVALSAMQNKLTGANIIVSDPLFSTIQEGTLASVNRGITAGTDVATVVDERSLFYLPENGIHENMLGQDFQKAYNPERIGLVGGGIPEETIERLQQQQGLEGDPLEGLAPTTGRGAGGLFGGTASALAVSPDQLGNFIQQEGLDQDPILREVPQKHAATVVPALQLASQEGNLPLKFVTKLAKIESSFNPKAKNKSGAEGLFQFIPSTAENLGLEDPSNPQEAAIAFAEFTNMNKRILTRKLGRAPQEFELYLAHQQGAAGATKLLTADPNEKAATVVGSTKRVTQNGGRADMTAEEFVQLWQTKYESI